MKRAAASLAALFVDWIGLEGVLFLVGTVCLAQFAYLLDPAGPWLVVGIISLSAAVALTIPRRRA